MDRSFWKRLAVLGIAGLMLACSRAPRWKYDDAGVPHEYKRYAQNLEVNYFTRFRKTAYRPVKKPIDEFLSDEQRQYISDNGQPDYQRYPFKSRLGEEVEEWAYLEKNKLVQFINGRIVYRGQVTDLERVMIRYGYPKVAMIGQLDPKIERFTYVYAKPWDRQRVVYSFANGKIIYYQTLR